ncbi:hypothetical protein MCON_3260 [Methanothrix soehngenii GP6]|uniref:Uncharacterized protein n=1 Tax=Methanothrix soehngenii (strain ATCC 5969 / DSM 3671 / JCM 10134 / NBRC 103675 / OCM 69 / GP-6) TaxID=990316 RepID=F4BUF6_METSG|nr:hypothetical protein MCON_3260 [Methanothrix soehngenii GP6]
MKLRAKLYSIVFVASSRASSTKTRIETPTPWLLLRCSPIHQEQVPRKQGLKHGQSIIPRDIDGTSRASSTKTRIETPMSPGRGSHVTDGKPDILIRPC